MGRPKLKPHQGSVERVAALDAALSQVSAVEHLLADVRDVEIEKRLLFIVADMIAGKLRCAQRRAEAEPAGFYVTQPDDALPSSIMRDIIPQVNVNDEREEA